MMRAWITAAVLVFAAQPAGAKSGLGDYIKTARMLKEWRFDEARESVEDLVARDPKAKETRYLQAEVAFLYGDYKQALQHLDGLDDDDVFGNVAELRSLVSSTMAATEGFARYESPSGKFIIYYPPGKDEVIVDLTADVLDRAYVTIGEDLGYEPNEPVRVEILSHPSDLARVSTLTAGEIETTGTIALCKYNKLMVVTPRATVLGYKWMDTMVHEYVHYAVSRASNDAVPVWLQEGLARFEQTRWREEPNTRLSGIEENLLATALADGKLVTFDEMHPSMAKLPDAETAALAFAEVYTMVGYLHGERGYEGLREIIALQKSGKSARRAVAEVMGERFGSVEKSWRAALRKRKLEKNAALAGHTGRARLRKGDLDATRDDDNAGVDTVANDRAQKFARLGGILRSRGMPEAAVVEYEKAHAVAANDPFVVGKLARTYVELGKHERAIELAEPMLSADDSDSALPTTLGMAYMAAKRAEDAAGAFEVALRVSPFDPAVRCGLAKAYSESGSAALAKRERKACDTLTDGKAVNTWTRIR